MIFDSKEQRVYSSLDRCSNGFPLNESPWSIPSIMPMTDLYFKINITHDPRDIQIYTKRTHVNKRIKARETQNTI